MSNKQDRKIVDSLKEEMLRAIQYPPKAKLAIMIEKEIGKKELYDERHYQRAVEELHSEGRIDQRDGWWYRTIPKNSHKLTLDDMHWLTSTGRFAQ